MSLANLAVNKPREAEGAETVPPPLTPPPPESNNEMLASTS